MKIPRYYQDLSHQKEIKSFLEKTSLSTMRKDKSFLFYCDGVKSKKKELGLYI